MAQITPFKINISDDRLSTLKQKLQLTTFPTELESAEWTYGVPLSEIKSLHSHWLHQYSWRTAESSLNQVPQYLTPIKIDGFREIDIHFVHQKSDNKNAIPLLFVHGWPGSFIEVVKMLPLLKEKFHVVAPSLANYGFSGVVREKGFGAGQHAEVLNELMLRLGYDRYVTQGGDWGSLITRIMGKKYPEHCKANHLNMIAAAEPKWTEENPKPEYTDYEKAAIAEHQALQQSGRGYVAIQSTKPATLAFSLVDSPTGLLAWIYEKLHSWSDSYPWTPDEILTWISIYYFSTAGPHASTYTYYEVIHDPVYSFSVYQSYIDVPIGVAAFPREVANAPESWWGGMGPVVSKKRFEKGGHFAAWERPEDLAGAVIEMFGEGGGAENVLKG